MKILFIGDIVGEPGRRAIEELLPGIKKANDVEFVIGNAENVAGGSGVTPSLADELFDHGLDVITSGDHIWKRKEIIDIDIGNPPTGTSWSRIPACASRLSRPPWMQERADHHKK